MSKKNKSDLTKEQKDKLESAITHIYLWIADKEFTMGCVFIGCTNPADPQIETYVYLDGLDGWEYREDKNLLEFTGEGATPDDKIYIMEVIGHDIYINRVLFHFENRIKGFEDTWLPVAYQDKSYHEFICEIWDDYNAPIEEQSPQTILMINEIMSALEGVTPDLS